LLVFSFASTGRARSRLLGRDVRLRPFKRFDEKTWLLQTGHFTFDLETGTPLTGSPLCV
jgi:hypothetical protein